MYILVYITTSGKVESEKIAKILLDERLVGCTNILPSIKSIYHWEGQMEEDAESLLIAKTDTSKIENIIEKVKEVHSYDNPCILAIPVIHGSQDYLNWLENELAK
ncbi:MAG: divalent-cation tolerance protein CutA [Methanomicrobiales archaeon]